MELIRIDSSRCTGCGRCLNGCSARVLIPQEEGNPPRLVENYEQRCIRCGHCVAICEFQAISVGDVTPENIIPIDQKELPTYQSFLNLVRKRRSIRHYQQRPLTQADIDRLLEIGRHAPTAKNLQLLKSVIINDPVKVRAISAVIFKAVEGDERFAIMLEGWKNGYDWILRGAPCVLITYTDEPTDWTVVDAAIALETIELGAVTCGIGSCWAGILMKSLEKSPELRAWLGLPTEAQVGGALMLGYPDDEEYPAAPWRKNPEVMVNG